MKIASLPPCIHICLQGAGGEIRHYTIAGNGKYGIAVNAYNRNEYKNMCAISGNTFENNKRGDMYPPRR